MPLHHKHQGQGAPLVLIHGLFGSLENLGAIARMLAHDFSVYSLDLPNHGRSPHVDDTSLPAMSKQVAQWMAQHKLENAHIVGHSLGGKTAMELALTRPALVDRLVVMDIAPSTYPPHHSDVFKGLLSVDIDNIRSRSEAEEAMKSHVPEIAVRSFLLKNIQRESSGRFSWRMNLTALHAHYADLICGNSNKVFDGDTLFLKGGASDYITEKNRDDIVRRFPKSALKVVVNTGHWLHAEKPEIVSKLIQRFLLSDR
ncbi:MAG: alpha/beta fold hydrolase [Agarilytica sp.]